MSDETDLGRQVAANVERIKDLEDIAVVTDRLIERVGELSGKVDVLTTQLTQHLLNLKEAVDHQSTSTDKLASWKTALQFAAAVVVPLLIALIGGYFALKAAGSK